MRGHEKMFSRKFSEVKVRHEGRFFDVDPNNEVLIGIAMSCGSAVVVVVTSVRLRAGYAKSHEILSAEARERAFSSFRGAPCVSHASAFSTSQLAREHG